MTFIALFFLLFCLLLACVAITVDASAIKMLGLNPEIVLPTSSSAAALHLPHIVLPVGDAAMLASLTCDATRRGQLFFEATGGGDSVQLCAWNGQSYQFQPLSWQVPTKSTFMTKYSWFLQLWIDAERNGDDVAYDSTLFSVYSWADRSPAQNHMFMQASNRRPVWNSADTGVQFGTGLNDFMFTQNDFVFGTSVDTGANVYAVVTNPSSDKAPGTLLFLIAGSFYEFGVNHGSTGHVVLFRSATDGIQTATAVSNAVFYDTRVLIGFHLKNTGTGSTSVDISINGQRQTTTTLAAGFLAPGSRLTGTATAMVGGRCNCSINRDTPSTSLGCCNKYFRGVIHEMIVTKEELLPDHDSAVMNDLMNKWMITPL